MKRILTAMIGIILAMAALSTSHADTYTHTNLASGYISEGINNAGTIVGSHGTHGFILSGGSYTSVDVSGATSTNITHKNDVGAIVGFYKDSVGNYHGYYNLGSYSTPLNYHEGTVTAAETYVTGINNAGTIVGWWAETSGSTVGHGFLLSEGLYTSINYPGAAKTYALGINDTGTIVGWYADATGEHGFTLSGGNYTSIDYPGTSKTHTVGINNAGTIVGSYFDGNGTQTGFTLSKGVFAPLSFTAYALGINDAGSIVGCWPYLGDLCSVYTGYTANLINVANIDNVSDTFTVWLDLKQGKDGTPAPDSCAGFLKIVDADGRTAVQQRCAFLDNGTGRHRVTLQITKDNQPNERARYIENASFYGCSSLSSSDPSDCSLISGTPADFSVYGTTFDISKHAWSFANEQYGNPLVGLSNSGYFTLASNLWSAAKVIESYMPEDYRSGLWYEAFHAHGLVMVTPDNILRANLGLCYGLANAAIAGFTHQDAYASWGTEAFTAANWNADIVQRDADNYKRNSPFNVPDGNIFMSPQLNNPETVWTIESAKKIMYYFVTQNSSLTGHGPDPNWVGKDQILPMESSTEPSFINILKGGSPVSFWVQSGSHQNAVPQLIIWNGHRNIMLWEDQLPLGAFSSIFYGPYLSVYYDNTSLYDKNGETPVQPTLVSTGSRGDVIYFVGFIGFVSPGCGDSQNIYNQWNGPCDISSQTNPSPLASGAATSVVDYFYPNHIQVLIIGAQLSRVHDNTTSSAVTLIPNGEIGAGLAVQEVSNNGLSTTLYLPVSDTYQIQATKYAGFAGLTVFVKIPNADGTVQILNYENLATAVADATHITFTVGRGNANTGISRTIANDIYNPDHNANVASTLNPPTNLKAIVNNSGTGVALSWTNTDNPSLASVLVIRKTGSAPTSSTDGTTVYNGTGQSVADTVTAGTVYYYAAYSKDNSGNLSNPWIRRVNTGIKSIYGTISLTGGGVLSNVIVQLIDGNNNVISAASSDTNGAYAISNIANGSYTLTASSSTADITNPSRSVAISGASQQVDFSATNKKTIFLLFDSLSVTVGNVVSIPWAYRNIGNNETVTISLLRNAVWETVASDIPILDGMVSWTVIGPDVTSATLKIALASNPAVNAQYTLKIASSYDFLGTPTSGPAPFAVMFVDKSSNSTAWLWNFGDGTTSTVQNPLHMYTISGTYNVSLTVTGSSGQTTVTKNGYVSVSGTCNELPVTIADTNDYYSTIDNALNYAVNGATLQLQATTLTYSLNMSRNISFKLSGGYSCNYSMNPGFTSINGTITVSHGTVTMDKIIIRSGSQ